MSTRGLLLVSLLGWLLLGCNRAPPAPVAPPVAPPPVDNKKEIDEALNKGTEDVGKQIEAAHRKLEQLKVTFLIDGVRDEKDEVFLKLQGLRDAGTKNTSVASSEVPMLGRYYRISPISDMEAAAEKIDFGLVVAIDRTERIILLDVSAKPVPRPAQGWPGAEAIDRFVVRKTALRVAQIPIYRDLVKKFSHEKVVFVLMPKAGSAPMVAKLRALAPDTVAESLNGFGPQHKDFFYAMVAPTKLSEVVKVLDGATNLAVDEERSVVILGLADLKLPSTRVGEQPAAPPK